MKAKKHKPQNAETANETVSENESGRAQMIWTFIVAIAVAMLAFQHNLDTPPPRSTASDQQAIPAPAPAHAPASSYR